MSPTKSGSKSTTRKSTRSASRSATSSNSGKGRSTNTGQQKSPATSTSRSGSASGRTSRSTIGNSRYSNSSTYSNSNSRQGDDYNRSQGNQYENRYDNQYNRNPRTQNQYSNYENRNRDDRYTTSRYDDQYDRNSSRHYGDQYQSRGRDGRFESDHNYQYQNQRGGRSQQPYNKNQWSNQQYATTATYPSGKNEEGLRKLLEAQLKDMYWAEKALTKALPKLIKNTNSEELMNGIEEHLEVTKEQVNKLEEVFQLLGLKAQAKKCEAMEGLIEEANEILSEMEAGPVRDAGIICAAQKVEHYEIATYGCLATYAEMLDEQEAADILHEILQEEKEADEKLSEAANTINWEALEEEDDEEEDENEDEEEDEDEDEEEDETEEEDEDEDEDEITAVESTNASPKISSSKATKSSTTKTKS